MIKKYLNFISLISNQISSSEKSLIIGSIWNFTGNFIGKLLILITTIFVAKLLGPDLFGKWGVIRSTSAVFSILLGFGVGVTSIKYVAEFRDTNKEKVGNIIGLSFALALILGLFSSIFLFFLSEYISLSIYNESSLIIPIKLSCFLLIFIAINGVLSACLAGVNSFSSIAYANIAGGIIGSIIIIFLTHSKGLNGLVLGYIIYYLVISIFLFFYVKKELNKNRISITLKDYKKYLSIIYNHNIPAILSGGIGGFVVWGVFAYVSRLTSGFSIIGMYNAAQIAQNTLIEIAAQVDTPIISFLSNSKNKERNKKINLFTPLVIGSLFILPIIYIPEILALLFRNSSFDNKNFLIVVSFVMLTTYIMIYKRGMGRSIITLNLMWWGVYENIFWSALLFSCVLFFVDGFGSIGLALSFSIAYLIDLIVIKPIYYKKKLIPKSLICSKEIIMIWISILLAPFFIFYNLDLYLRVIILIVIQISHYFWLKELLRKI